jgi:hypothetical protein
MVTGNEVRVQVSLNDVLNPEATGLGRVNVEVNIPLRVNNGGDTPGDNRVGRVGQTPQVKSLNADGLHAAPPLHLPL